MNSIYRTAFLSIGLLVSTLALANPVCGTWDTIPVMNGEYIVQNNIWGATTSQCISVPDINTAGFIVSQSAHNQNTVAGYPSIYRGCHWGTCTKNSGMPVLISRIIHAPFSLAAVPAAQSGKWNIIAEAWFSPRDYPDKDKGYDGGAELLIWLDDYNGMRPRGNKLERMATIGGFTWEVWVDKPNKDANWQYIAYRRTGQISVSLDLNDFLKDALANSYLDPTLYLHNLEAGTEIMTGGAGFTTKSFAFSVTSDPPPKLTVSKTGNGSGTVTSNTTGIDCGTTCTANFNSGINIALSATAAENSLFAGWNGGGCSGTGACNLTLNADTTVAATFTLKPVYTLLITKSGSGIITSNPGGINCGSDCTEKYNSGTPVTLTATPGSGYLFARWGGACTGTTPTCTVTMSAIKSVTATFTHPILTVTKAGSGSGVISGIGINCGVDCVETYTLTSPATTVLLTAKPATGSTFVSWSGCYPIQTLIATPFSSCSVTLDASKTVTAKFDTNTVGTYALTIYKTGNGSGTVTSNPAGINCGSSCVANLASATPVTLTAAPDTGSNSAVVWTGCTPVVSNPKQCTTTINAARIVTVTFTRPVLTVTKSGSGTVKSTPSGINCGTDCTEVYNLNTTVNLTAVPASGYSFGGWSNACSGTGACSVTLSMSKTVKAAFTATP